MSFMYQLSEAGVLVRYLIYEMRLGTQTHIALSNYLNKKKMYLIGLS